MAFEFDDDTAFEGHKGSSDGPKKRRGGRTSKAGDKPRSRAISKAAPEPGPEEPPATPAVAEIEYIPVVPIRRTGVPRSGRYPVRLPRAKAKRQKDHNWAKSNRWVKPFLKAVSTRLTVTAACEHVMISAATVYNRCAADPDFKAALKQAQETFADRVEEEVCRRALEGDEAFVQDKKTGQWISLGNKADNLLLMFLMKKLRREYRDNFQGTDAPQSAAVSHLLVKFLTDYKPELDDQSGMKTFEQFLAEQSLPPPLAAIEGPPETKEAKRQRLMAELDALDDTDVKRNMGNQVTS